MKIKTFGLDSLGMDVGIEALLISLSFLFYYNVD
ncbi:unnamed protein product [Spirodela intermedia]|uniref:Uncharacterized protein n=1 Tax=Spirodela intermedia TaxID=51605 RepID=A0A7I8JR20_SPIIN|nr:unnamed protein product [Spirodela intermedia]CAA6672608.1 unnamed protein product [Spirodela intermedia]